MKLHFDDIFLHNGGFITPKFNIKSGEIIYKKGEKFPDYNIIFGATYAVLLNHDFELASLPEGGYEIKAYYVR